MLLQNRCKNGCVVTSNTTEALPPPSDRDSGGYRRMIALQACEQVTVVIYIVLIIYITVTLTFLQDCEEKHMRSGGSHALTGNPGLAAFLNFSLLVSLASTLSLT